MEMKKLKRMLLIHWHHYDKEVIDFDMINFLTGKTAAGKSTIIDALQLVLLGDTSGTFFNKAANQKSARTMRSYLFGEMGDDGDAGFRYLRNERFSSYVVLEFEDTERHGMFTAGIVCDCYKDQSFDYKWFVLHASGIPDNLFIDEQTATPFDIAGLKSYLTRTMGKKKSGTFEFYDTNRRYQEVTLGKFGQLKTKYRTLLRKAVPFTPISDIEKFITESICDVRNNIDVEQMQSDIRQYKNLEEDARTTQERIGRLRVISETNAGYEKEKDRYLQQSYIVRRAELKEQEDEEQRLKDDLEERLELISQNEDVISSLEEEEKELRLELKKLEEEYHGSDLAHREKELRRELEETKEKIRRILEDAGRALQGVKRYGEVWEIQLKNAADAGFSREKTPAGVSEMISTMKNLQQAQLESFPFAQAAERLDLLRRTLEEYRINLKTRADQLKRDIAELEDMVHGLEKGIKPYPGQVSELRRILQQALFQKHNLSVEIPVLADTLEIRDPRWRNAIEGYLDKQKFYLLIPEKYYREAVGIYSRYKQSHEVYDAGIIDTGRLKKDSTRKPLPKSLAEEIETQNPDARLYADYVLGSVIKCDQAEELNKYRTAITDTCMLYKGYVARKLNPARYATPFIGRHSMELLLNKRREELKRTKDEYDDVLNRHEVFMTVAGTGILSEFEAQQYAESVSRLSQKDTLEKEEKKLKEEYDGLDLMYLERMKERIRTLEEQDRIKAKELRRLENRNAGLQAEVRILRERDLPEKIKEITQLRNIISQEFDERWIAEIGEPRFAEACSRTGDYTRSLRERYLSAMRQTQTQRDRMRSARTNLRSEYNSIYKMPYDIELESNRDFDRELEELEQIRLPEYIEKIKDSRRKAYDQFRDDLIAKIKSNIESVSQQIDELNDALKKSVFGTDRYQFVKSPRPEYRNYYDMIMDPLLMDTGGWNIASQSFNSKYQKEIDELFQLLIMNETNISAERRAEYEKSIRKFTDYKTYLVFDLIVTDEQGEKQRLSRTLLKKSGGETQIPFYIALLASFSQVCRIRNKNQNNTLRVIILDEAFSKMDGERIRESIHLLRRFELQAIFSAPPEKVPDIAPLVDRNIAVYKDNRHAFTRYFDPKQIIEEDIEEE